MADQSYLYDTLSQTARSFVLSTSPQTAGTNKPNPELVLSLTAPTFTHSWGHKHFASTNPGVQGIVDAHGFLDRMARLSSRMQTWRIDITDISVDVQKRKGVVTADFRMTVAGNEAVLNELVWMVGMDETGGKVVDSCEFIDPMANQAIMELMRRAA